MRPTWSDWKEHKLREEDPRLVARKQAPQNMEVNTEASKSLEEPRLGARRRSLRGAASDPVTVPLTPGRETPGRAFPGGGGGLDCGGDGDDWQETREVGQVKGQKAGDRCLDRQSGGLSVVGQCMEQRPGDQHHEKCGESFVGAAMEKDGVATSCEAAVEKEGQGKLRWKRNPRWISLMIGTEVAALWGHFGAMRQKLRAPDVVQRC